jgi:hypothetical protein
MTDHNRSSGGKGPPASLVGGNPVGMTADRARASSGTLGHAGASDRAMKRPRSGEVS